MRKYLTSLLIYLALYLCSSSVVAQVNIISLKPNQKSFTIAEGIYYLIDTTSSIDIQKIQQPQYLNLFNHYPKKDINLGQVLGNVWICFEFENLKSNQAALEIVNSNIQDITIYRIAPKTNDIDSLQTGMSYPFIQREIKINNLLFYLPQKGTIYLKIEYKELQQPVRFKLRIGSFPDFVEYYQNLNFSQGIFFGIAFLIIFYNLFLFASTRELTYLFYSLFVLGQILSYGQILGYNFEYLWPNYPFLNNYDMPSFGAFFGILFAYYFLSIKYNLSKPLYYFSLLLLIVSGIFILLSITGLWIKLLDFLPIFILFAGLYQWILALFLSFKGIRSAKFYLIAWSTYLTSITIYILILLEVIPSLSDYNLIYVQLGGALEMILLSFGVGDKINHYKKERNKVRQENYALIQKQKAILEKGVRERTSELKQKNEELQNSNDVKDKLFSIISHDLRGPIGNLKMLFNLFEEGEISVSEIESVSGTLSKDINEMYTLIENLLYWAKSQMSKGIETNPVTIDLKKLVNENIALSEAQAKRKNIKLLNQVIENTFVLADREMLKLIIRNLINNSIKFTPDDKNIYISSETLANYINLKVRDEGVGISPEIVETIFQEKTASLSSENTKSGKGTGLGLMLSYEFIKKNNGDIGVESEVGKGSTFFVKIPKASINENGNN